MMIEFERKLQDRRLKPGANENGKSALKQEQSWTINYPSCEVFLTPKGPPGALYKMDFDTVPVRKDSASRIGGR